MRIRTVSARVVVGADDSVGPIDVANLPRISEKRCILRADRVVRPYDGMWQVSAEFAESQHEIRSTLQKEKTRRF